MAKSKVTAYHVSGLSPLYYSGKIANIGDVVTDIPGESIGWLIEQGFITLAQDQPVDTTPDAPVADPTPVDSAPATDPLVSTDTTATA
jgi:hypothetical protein